MRLTPERLEGQLTGTLAPLYLIAGDETLLVEEAGDRVREAARRAGFGEREVLYCEAGFDWSRVLQSTRSLSLFAERRLVELRLASAAPGTQGAQALQEYLASPSPDLLLLMLTPNLDSQAQKAPWVAAADRAGVVVIVRPVALGQLPGWIAARTRARGLQMERQAVELLVQRVEGNLLAAAQEVDKLLLLHGPGRVSVAEVAAAVADSARFDVFALVEAALLGDGARATRVLHGLRGEGVEATLVLWALARELRTLATLAAEIRGGASVAQALNRARVWERRKAQYGAALKRLSVDRCRQLLRLAARVDRAIKGIEPGDPWDALLELSLGMSGLTLLSPAA